MCLSPGVKTEPAIPILPEDTEKEDDKETFKANKGMDRCVQGKADNGTLPITSQLWLHSVFVLSHSHLKVELAGHL